IPLSGAAMISSNAVAALLSRSASLLAAKQVVASNPKQTRRSFFIAVLYNARVLYRGIEHPALASPDPERLARWYAETLEFPIAWEDGKTPPAYLLKTPNGGLLEII